MSNYKMIEIEIAGSQNRSQSNLPARDFLCRLCKRGFSEGVIIHPCSCTDHRKFMHIHCLEYYTTKSRNRHCMFCHAPFPIKQRNKSLLKWCRNREAWLEMLQDICDPLFKIFGLLLIDMTLIALIIYLFLILNTLQTKQYIRVTVFISVFLTILVESIYIQIIKIRDFVKRIRKSYNKWYSSNQEMKITNNISHVTFETW